MKTSHDLMIEDHSQDWWDRATMCFLTLQTVVERSGQQRHLVRAGGGRKGGNEKGRMGTPLTRRKDIIL